MSFSQSIRSSGRLSCRWALHALSASLAIALAGCGTQTVVKTVTSTSSSVGPTSTAATATTTASSASTTPAQTYTGTGQKLLGTINVSTDTTVSWSCPGCGNTNFIINNAASDSQKIPTNGLNQTSGVDPLPAGAYHTVVVDTTSGPWSVTIGGSGTSAPVTTSQAPAPTATSSPGTPSSTGGGDPLATVSAYWGSIGAHDFSAAYADLVPGSVGLTETQFVSGEQQAGIQSVSFNGHVVSNDGSTATATVDSLTTHDRQFGCRAWSDSYQLSNSGGQWLIEKASITPSPCG